MVKPGNGNNPEGEKWTLETYINDLRATVSALRIALREADTEAYLQYLVNEEELVKAAKVRLLE